MLFLSIPLAPHPPLPAGCLVSGQSLLISEFYPCALCSDEYFAIHNPGTVPASLGGWTVSDGEGTLTFLADLVVPPKGRICASANGSAFERAFGRPPEVLLSNRSAVSCSGSFRLADVGDSISLSAADGSLIDFVAYGDAGLTSAGWTGPAVPSIRQGEVAKRVVQGGAARDTDCSADWFPFREYRYGFTEFQPLNARVPGGSVVAFASPDCSLDVILSGIQSAGTSLRVCTYELNSIPVCRALLDAKSRGVYVRLLLDGAPAGGIAEDEALCLSVLAAAGMTVRTVNGNLSMDSVQHVGALHSKYMIVDDIKSFVLSENFVTSGLSRDAVYGNRGWGISVEDAGIAAYLSRVFDSDGRPDRTDVADWSSSPRFDRSAVLPEEQAVPQRDRAVMPLATTVEASVQVIVSPDASTSSPYLSAVMANSADIIVSQFQADVTWGFRWIGERTSPLVDSLVYAMRGGARVRGLFDSSWYNLEGNERIVSLLSGIATNETLEGAFAQLDVRSPISILHNKGAVMDGRRTLVSSNNWCYASFARNRELALVIDSEEVASYFTRVFELDWVPDTAPPTADAGFDRSAPLGGEVLLDGRRSGDDRAIASWSWDIGGDGVTDSNDSVCRHVFERPGTYRVVLRVVDGWGNEGMDTVLVEVVDPTDPGGWLLPEGLPWWAPPLSGSTGALAGVLLARRRLRAQNVNHRGGA